MPAARSAGGASVSARREDLRLADRVALVTGAASGIGLAIARALVARGAHLVITDIDARGLATAHGELAASGQRVASVVLDIADDAAVAQAAARIPAECGPVHLVFNNAGIDMSGRLASMALQDWRRAFDINVFGLVHGLRHFLPLLQAHGERAHLLNTASGMGLWVNPDTGVYAATKHAVIAISEALERELAGTPVGVSVLCPGPVATPLAERSPHASTRLRESLAAGIPPDVVAQWVLDEIAQDVFYIFTPTRQVAALQRRTDRVLQAVARMRASGRFPALR